MGMIVLFIHIYYTCHVQSQQLNEKCNIWYSWREDIQLFLLCDIVLNVELNSAVLLVWEAV